MSRLLDKQLIEECDRVGGFCGVSDLLEQGADANAYDGYHSALGNAVYRIRIEAIEHLLSYGACVHWHNRNLSGTHGDPIDTLGIALRNFGLDFALRLSNTSDAFNPEFIKDSEDVIAQEFKVVLMLLKAGADVSLPDAATHKFPMEAFCDGMGVWETGMYSEKILSEGEIGIIFKSLVEAVLNRSSQKNNIKSMILEGNWEGLPEGWGGIAKFPAIHNIIHSFIQEKEMLTQTFPAKKTTPSLGRL